uniref:Nudix hydrolase 18 n=1 Tax=Accipiter nisus TaxID=211598 RepID=A0A8B9NJU4_9AVES
MGEAPVPELDAVLGGGGWDVGASFEGPPPPTVPIRLGRNACYVVLAVLFNEEDKVLLVQEAKPECRGRWYLPAGRMEPGESIVAAMRREVKEETGLECEPLTLLALEERGPAWIRFAFLARPTGACLGPFGALKGRGKDAARLRRSLPALCRGIRVPCQLRDGRQCPLPPLRQGIAVPCRHRRRYGHPPANPVLGYRCHLSAP